MAIHAILMDMPKGHTKGFRWTTPEARFWKHTQITEGCWLWTAHCLPTVNHPELRGHGQLTVDGVRVLAHRLSWELHYGLVPLGLCVLHHCDTPSCVRPDHLFTGTRKDNTQDALRKDRLIKGEAASWAILTEVQVRTIIALHATGGVSYCALARRYGVCDTTIRHIIQRRNWKHIV